MQWSSLQMGFKAMFGRREERHEGMTVVLPRELYYLGKETREEGECSFSVMFGVRGRRKDQNPLFCL